MKRFLAPNLDRTGRWVRAVYGALLIAAGWWLGRSGHPLPALAAVLAGGFAWLEAVRAWCILRACGIRTRW